MNPKKHKEFKKGIAEKVGVHQQVVDDFISFYYSKIRKKLSTLDYPRIKVCWVILQKEHIMDMLKVKV